VRKGQVLARLEQMNERNQLLAAQAALNAARAELVRSRDALQRQQSLIDEGFTTRANLDTAMAAFRSGEAQVKSAQAQVQMAEDLVGFTVLVAEYDGSVTARGAERGEVVQGGRWRCALPARAARTRSSRCRRRCFARPRATSRSRLP